MATDKNSTKALDQQRNAAACALMREAVQQIIAMRRLALTCSQELEDNEGASNAMLAMRSMLNACGYVVERGIRTLDPTEPGILGDADSWILADSTLAEIAGLTEIAKTQEAA